MNLKNKLDVLSQKTTTDRMYEDFKNTIVEFFLEQKPENIKRDVKSELYTES